MKNETTLPKETAPEKPESEHGSGSLFCSQDSLPSEEAMFYAIRSALSVLHELSVKVTGDGFAIHNFLDSGVILDSRMSMPANITFHAEA